MRSDVALLLAASFALLLASAGSAAAQPSGPYALTRSTLDAGGATFSTGGPYGLGGTIAQPDAGALSGGDYTLQGGFWIGNQLWPTDVGDSLPALTASPVALRLRPIAPNPAVGRARISFDLPAPGPVQVELFSLSGRRVRTLVSGTRPAGTHHVLWDGTDESGRRVPAGIYFVSVRAGRSEARSRLVLLQ